MMSSNIPHDPFPTEDDTAEKSHANKDEATSSSSPKEDDEKIKVAALDDSAALKTTIDDIEGSEELQLSFPERLMSLLQDGGNKGQHQEITKAMRWLPGGEAFLIVPSIFYDVVLDGHFHGTKFESFTRKLNRWGFKRLSGKTIPKDCIAYHHALFSKDHPELLDKMRSGRNRHVFVEEQKPAKKQAAAAAAAASRKKNTSLMNQQQFGGGTAGFSNNYHPLARQARAGLYPQGLSSSFGLSASDGGVGGQIPPHMEADLVLRRRLDEAMLHSQNNNNNGYSTSQADQLEALRCGGGSYSPQMIGGGGSGGCDSSMEMQRIMALRQQQQQQQGMAYGGGGGGGGVDLLMGCNSDMSYNNNHDNNQAHFMAMRQLLVDQRAAARATEESLRLQQLLSMQQQGGVSVGNVGGSVAGGGAADFASTGNNSSAQDAKFYQLMRLRQQLDMVTRNS